MEITIENFLYDLILTIISSVLGAALGIIIPKLMKCEDVVKVDKQLVFAQIHIEQNQYIYNAPTTTKTISRDSSREQDIGGGERLAIYLIGSLVLIYAFLRFESQISRVILIFMVLLESIFLTTTCMVIKRDYVDKSIRSILAFNIFATICVPILLYLMKNPITNSSINKELILDKIAKEGVFSLLNDVGAYGFLLYQALGIIILFGFMLFTLSGTVHILSMINLSLGNRLIKVWQWLYKKTIRFCNSAGFYIVFGILLLALSFLFVSGILVSVFV